MLKKSRVFLSCMALAGAGFGAAAGFGAEEARAAEMIPVSYTHLTLPTIA